jgi:hypothetical protein
MAERREPRADDELVEIDRRLRGIQLGLAPGREPAPVRDPRPLPEPPSRPDPSVQVTTKLIASMRELLDALESATATSDRPATD